MARLHPLALILARRLAMSFTVWWILFGVPLIAVVAAWVGLS